MHAGGTELPAFLMDRLRFQTRSIFLHSGWFVNVLLDSRVNEKFVYSCCLVAKSLPTL